MEIMKVLGSKTAWPESFNGPSMSPGGRGNVTYQTWSESVLVYMHDSAPSPSTAYVHISIEEVSGKSSYNTREQRSNQPRYVNGGRL